MINTERIIRTKVKNTTDLSSAFTDPTLSGDALLAVDLFEQKSYVVT